MSQQNIKKLQKILREAIPDHREDMIPDWTGECAICGQRPTVPITQMCGPCTFGEADTAGGNW